MKAKFKAMAVAFDSLKRQEDHANAKLSPAQRLEACVEMSDFIGDLRDAYSQNGRPKRSHSRRKKK